MAVHDVSTPLPSSNPTAVGALRRALWGDAFDSLGVMRSVLPMYAISSVLLLLAAALGVLVPWRAGVLVTYLACAWTVPYAWIRSGRTQRLTDPRLTYPSLLLTIGAVVLAYSLLDLARGASLLWLSPLLAEHMAQLQPRRVLQAALTTVGLLATAIITLWCLNPEHLNLREELLTFVMIMVMLPVCALVAREVQRTRARQATQREELNRTLTQLKELSAHDALTGLGNRRHMMTLLEEEIKRQRRAGQTFGIAIIDLDHFKHVNDTHGHAVGDAVLQRFATLVQPVLAPTDALARWGGEEFLLLLPDADARHAGNVLATIRQVVSEHNWGALAAGLRVTFSAGVALHERDAALHDTLESADQSLYRAKQAGRDGAYHQTERLSGMPRAVAAVQKAAPISALATGAHRAMQIAGTVLEQAVARPLPALLLKLHPLFKTICAWVMGDTNEMRDNLRLSVIASVMYLFWIAVINGYGVPNGLISPVYQPGLLVIDLIGALAFYPLIRSGLSAQWRDPELSLLQISWGCVAAMACYVAMPALRASVLQAMCLVQIFGMVKLSPRECRLAGAVAIASTLVALPVMHAHEHFSSNVLQVEVIKTVLTCTVLFQLTRMSGQFSAVRQQVAQDQTELARAVEQLRDMAIRDPLTGLYNRRHLLERLERERQRSVHLNRPFCVAMLDIDHFKRVNDTYGHNVGDEVLCAFARALHTIMRESDVVGRWGGEEFLVLLPDTSPGQALAALDRLRKHLVNLQVAAGEPALRATLSGGVAAHDAHATLDRTIERADQALYAAKTAGRDRCLAAD